MHYTVGQWLLHWVSVVAILFGLVRLSEGAEAEPLLSSLKFSAVYGSIIILAALLLLHYT